MPTNYKPHTYKRGDKVRLLDSAFQAYSPANLAETRAAAGVNIVEAVRDAHTDPPTQQVDLVGPLRPYLFLSCDLEPA